MTMTIERTNAYTLAKHTPSLQGQTLCTFLDGMDTAEQLALTQEQQSVQTGMNALDKQYNFLKVAGKMLSASGCITAFYSAVRMKYYQYYCDTLYNPSFCSSSHLVDYDSADCMREYKDYYNIIYTTSAVLFLSGLIMVVVPVQMAKSSSVDELNLSVATARILRLQLKITQISARILAATTSDVEKAQLGMAEAYFTLMKAEMIYLKFNTIRMFAN